MRRVIVTLILVCVSVTVFTQDAEGDRLPAEDELRTLLLQAAEMPVTELRLHDLTLAFELASVADQQREHVKHSARLSTVFPGLGQYVNGDTGRALIFAATDLVVGVTAAVLAYWLLPPAVQWRNLNYLQTPMADIETRWKSLTPGELIPSLAVAASGSLLGLVVRGFASEDAAVLARSRILDGSIIFEPEFSLK